MSEFSTCEESVALPALTISENLAVVTEGGTATCTLNLTSATSSNTTVKLSVNDTDVATVMSSDITFTVSDYSETVTVTGVADDDAENEAAEIRHFISIGGNDFLTAQLPVEVTDDHAPTLSLTSTTTGVTFPSTTDVSEGYLYDGAVRMNESETGSYTVELSSEPSGDVTIDLKSSDSGLVSVSPGSLTFTKTGEAQDAGKYQWDVSQTVTLTSVSDSDAEDEIEAVSDKMTIDKKDYVLARVAAIIRDSALPGLTYTPDTVSVPEGGTADYTVALVSDPGDGVTIVVNVAVSLISTTGNAITVSPSSLTFTGGPSGNWETPQTVTVTGLVDDDQFEDLAKITHTTVRDGITYNWPKVTVSVSDGNRAPFFEDGLKTTRSIDENSDEGAVVGAPVVAIDLNNDILTYEIEVTESGPYTVDSTTGQIRLGVGVSLDHENKTTQEVKLTVKDPSGLSDAIEVAIEIANVNEPPMVSGTGTLSYPENTATTRVLHRYTATDPESGSITWSVMGADGSAFTIDSSGNLKFSSQPDHETQDEYSITIIATDDGDP